MKNRYLSIERKKGFIYNVLHTIVANFSTFIASALVVAIVPKIIDIKQYGYYQLYIFYVSYLGIFNYGWSEGLLLKYGGRRYEELEYPILASQFRMFSLLQLIGSLIIILAVLVFCKDINTRFTIYLCSINLLTYLPSVFLRAIMQSTDRIKAYAAVMTFERLLYVVLITLVAMNKSRNFISYAMCDVAVKALSFIVIIIQAKEITLGKSEADKSQVLHEIKDNILSGLNIMIANLAGLFIIGTVRYAIQWKWNIETFAKVSLTISVSNLLMTFIRAVSVVIYPMLRREEQNKLSAIYNSIRTVLMGILFTMLIAYYPVRAVLAEWLPQYAESLKYMAILFPLCIFESKTSLLIETYLKTLRKERWILLVNVVSVSISVIISLITVFVLGNLDLAILSITCIQCLKCILGEYILSKIMFIIYVKNTILEICLTAVFILAGWYLDGVRGIFVYLLAYFLFLMLQGKNIRTAIGQLIH
jgi:O-antigen/teichoic acid export membrane protein